MRARCCNSVAAIDDRCASPALTNTGWPPNMRMKLTARGGRLIGNRLFMSAAAAGRRLCAVRYAAPP